MGTSSAVIPGPKRARTRDQLLVAAQMLLAEQGATGLGLRRITDQAGVAHPTFYNYYPDIAALVADLGELLAATHAVAMAAITEGLTDPATRFARVTRQTLRIIAEQPGFGRLMFDVGLPAGSLIGELRLRLRLDIAEGVERGVFRVSDLDLAASMVAGAISGLALDLHRGGLPLAAIDTGTARLLELLGLDARSAEALGHEAIDFPPSPGLPMRWLALPTLPHPEPRDGQ